MTARAFAKWGIDFVGPIKPASRHTQATDYLTKWVEAKGYYEEQCIHDCQISL